MSSWILIIMLAARSSEGGVAVNTVKFKSKQACMEAKVLVEIAWHEAQMGWPKQVAVCAEDK